MPWKGRRNVTDIKIIPIGPHVLVETEVVDEKTKGGIYIPDKVRDQQNVAATKGKILALGDDAFCEIEKESGMPQIGDRVIMARYAGMPLEDGNLRICEDGDIVAVIRSE